MVESFGRQRISLCLRDLSGKAQSIPFAIDHVRGVGRKPKHKSINQTCEETRSITLVETVKNLIN